MSEALKTIWEAVIGLEIHVQIATAAKQFCSCPAIFTNDPADANKYVCPVCLGHPGTLPVLNRKSVELALRLAAAARARVAPKNVFARKNYFYPDLPKGYQISQYEIPLASGGALAYFHRESRKSPWETREARLVRMHLEEDTGKSFHLPDGSTLVDFNRSGVPLLEIVTEPCFRTPDEAVSFLEELRLTLVYLGVSGANMELGQMRCEPNVSVRPAGTDELRAKVELKNLNSFATLKKAVEFEIARQAAEWERGGRVLAQTMRWDEGARATVAMRTKETADDYRYFDEPDLPPLSVTDAMLNEAAAFAERTAYAIRKKLAVRDGLSDYDAANIAGNPSNLEWYEALAAKVSDAKLVANWVLGEISRWRTELGDRFIADRGETAALLGALAAGKINNAQAKLIFEKMAAEGASAESLISSAGIAAESAGENALTAAVSEAIAENPRPVADYKSGKTNAIMVLVGQVMKKTKGAADAAKVRELLEKELSSPQ
ncbi:MAG: Asp-tRNA(Asn)/Glu-tRNA(Gln) amidotransferase subunit GatB [bacterium]|jgi:aspartyl-tRNA(Asn)/glutamyl-tRNA(Gln) amidotransferase subunit B